MKSRAVASLLSLIAAGTLAGLPSSLHAEEPAAKPLKVGPLSFSLTAPWKLSDKQSPMSQGTIELPGKDGARGLTATFFHFGSGQGGDLAGNIKRWQGMFQAAPEPKQEEFEFGKAKATLISLSGTYVGSRFSPEPEPRTGYTLVAAVLPSSEGDIYVRLVGPEAAVTAAKEDFKKLLLTAAAK